MITPSLASDFDTIRNIVLKSYGDAGVSPNIPNPDDVFQCAMLSPWTTLIYINNYCYMCIARPELKHGSIKKATHEEIALMDLEDGIKHRWAKTGLYKAIGKEYLNYVKNWCFNSQTGQKFNVLEEYIKALRVLSVLENAYDDGTSLTKTIPFDLTSEELKKTNEAREALTEAILSVKYVNVFEQYKFFFNLEKSAMNRRLNDVYFYLRKNYLLYCSDERVTELFNDVDSVDGEFGKENSGEKLREYLKDYKNHQKPHNPLDDWIIQD